jgi:hypothetical protein
MTRITVTEERKAISKQKRKVFPHNKIDYYVNMKGWQLNQNILENSLVNCFPTLEERLNVIDILKKLQTDQFKQVNVIKDKMPINKKNTNYERVSEWMEKNFKGVNIGVSMMSKTLSELEKKILKEGEGEVEESEEEEEEGKE